MDPVNFGTTMAAAFRYFDDQDGKTKKRPKKTTPSDKKHVGATYPALPPPPPAYTVLATK